MKRKGDRILVKENKILGTPEAQASIKEVYSWGYDVVIDGDDPEWWGPVDKDGEVLCNILYIY